MSTITRNLRPTESQLDNATTIRKLAARLNALVAEMDAEDAERRDRGLNQPIRRRDACATRHMCQCAALAMVI